MTCGGGIGKRWSSYTREVPRMKKGTELLMRGANPRPHINLQKKYALYSA